MRGMAFKLRYLALVAPVAAAAQQAQINSADSGAQLGEIVITARKTSEDLQHAAIAVTAVSSQEIERAGIKDPTDLQWRLPAVEIQSATSIPAIFIRGVGTYNLQAGVDSAVAFSIDGIYLAHAQAYPPVLVDIAQVESVRGPQGTLYGRNSNGGAISFASNKPVLGQWDAEAGITTGNYSELGTEAMLNVPLGDKLAMRFAWGTDRHDNYYTNGYQDGNNYTGRWRVLYQPLDNLEIIATLDKSRIKNDGNTNDRCPPRSDYAACVGVPFEPWTGIGPRDPADFNRIDSWGAYLEANLSLGWGTVTSLSSYRDTDWNSHQILTVDTGSGGFTQGETARVTTQEIRVAAPTGSRINWIFGGYYSRERTPYREALISDGASFFVTNPDLSTDSKALFGQITYPIIDGLRVTGGVRYTNEKKSAQESANIVAGVATVPVSPSTELNKVTWKAGLEYDVAAHSLVYGSVSTGFKSGGVNEVPNTPDFQQTYNPETITAYQIGSKNRFWSERLQVNVEGFFYDYKGFQTLEGLTDPTGTYPGLFLETANSDKATMYGGELETTFAITAHDHLSITPTYLHARFNRFVVGGTDLSGHHIEAAGPYTISGAYDHAFVLPSSAKIVANMSTELVGGHYMDNSNSSGSYQPTYTRSTATLTYEDVGGHWTVSAFIRNIENTGAIMTWGPPSVGNQDLVQVYPPRTYGLSVKWRL
jgi:iron complex outermembrane receptor protein